MYICIYTNTYMHTLISIYNINISIYRYIHIYIYICTFIYVNTIRVIFSLSSIILGILKIIFYPEKSLDKMPEFLLSKPHFFMLQICVLKTGAQSNNTNLKRCQ